MGPKLIIHLFQRALAPGWLALACAAVAASLVAGAGSLASSGPAAMPPVEQRLEPIRPIPPPPAEPPARVDLGRRLFAFPLLSHDSGHACSSCHDVTTNGADAAARDTAPDGKPIRTNTNTVFNAALSFRLDWIGDARSLEEQAAASLQRPDLMGTTPEEVVRKLRANEPLSAGFRAVYGRDPNWTDLLDALATYERTLVTPDSRFDLWLRGQPEALSADELAGYRLFKTAGCVSCHQGVNVGGNLYEKNGIFRPLLAGQPRTMRVPSLRNVAMTPPYFHDGSVPDLGNAVQKMAAAQLGRTFTDDEARQVVAFLGTLTGRYEGRLVSQPKP